MNCGTLRTVAPKAVCALELRVKVLLQFREVIDVARRTTGAARGSPLVELAIDMPRIEKCGDDSLARLSEQAVENRLM